MKAGADYGEGRLQNSRISAHKKVKRKVKKNVKRQQKKIR